MRGVIDRAAEAFLYWWASVGQLGLRFDRMLVSRQLRNTPGQKGRA
jgi:hypothetical protein